MRDTRERLEEIAERLDSSSASEAIGVADHLRSLAASEGENNATLLALSRASLREMRGWVNEALKDLRGKG